MAGTFGRAAPSSTYRLQFGPDFGFDDAIAIVPYLRVLGVDWVYASPCLQARTGSVHGYDVTDPTRLNDELGGEEGFHRLGEALRRDGLGLLLDVVPNHMAASPQNPWWRDVLENGPASEFSPVFDIDWRPPHAELEDRIILPVLGDRFGAVLERGELRLVLDQDGIAVAYFDQHFPLDPATYAEALGFGAGQEPDPRAGKGPSGTTAALGDVLGELAALPGRSRRATTRAEARSGRSNRLKREFLSLVASSDPLRAELQERLGRNSGNPGDAASFDTLEQLLRKQVFRLAFWKMAADEINYRRFFDIAELVAVRAERDEVFEMMHSRVLELLRQGSVQGLRIDHIDGLRDPAGYLERLRQEASYVVVEKILAADEDLPGAWPVSGTTGYDFLNALNAIFVDPAGLETLDRVYHAFTGRPIGFDALLYERKKAVILDLFEGEVRGLERALAALARRDRHGCDIGAPTLGRALVALSAALPAYRSYMGEGSVGSADRALVERAATLAATHDPGADADALGFLRRLLLAGPRGLPGVPELDRTEFVLRWQQFTGPAMAKGLEDTTLYLFNRLVSLNAVGSEPGDVDVSLRGFHERLAHRAGTMPDTMNTTSTHDSKRSEDVRARIHVISELASEWEETLAAWSRINEGLRRRAGGRSVPDRNEEILLYQTLVGAWPLDSEELEGFADRIAAYMVKAAREAKENTSWLERDEAYENALVDFVRLILDGEGGSAFREAFLPLQRRIAFLGALNSLAQVVLKGMAPGLPDFYQGTELWDFSLVDPDNRRPVDFHRNAALLAGLDAAETSGSAGAGDAGGRAALCRALLDRWRTGEIKLLVTTEVMRIRRELPELFRRADYRPLGVGGERRSSTVSFARTYEGRWVIAVAGLRHAARSPGNRTPVGEAGWGASMLDVPNGAPQRWVERLTARPIRLDPGGQAFLAELLDILPVAILISD